MGMDYTDGGTSPANQAADTAICVRHVTKAFGHQTVLKDISLSVERGSICGILGRNGCGKSVLFKCICGIYIPDAGSVEILGSDIRKKPEILNEIGMIIESPAFLDSFSGYRNLKLLSDLTHKVDRERILSVLESVGLSEAAGKKAGKYSMGMKQRLAIAQAMMEYQKILVLDEPMNGLDNRGVEEIRDLLLALAREGTTILLASHNAEDIRILCDQVHRMDGGVLI